MNAGIVFLTIIIFIVHLMLSAEVGSTAERMNRSFGVWMLLALIISPVYHSHLCSLPGTYSSS